MEQKIQHKICPDSIIYDVLPPITAKYPWFVCQNPEAEKDGHIFCNLNDPQSSYHCRIPELFRKRIRGCFHGWLILSDNPHNESLTWSLWNPNTSKIICLPPLILKDGDYESIKECCLTFPPDNPSSVLLLTRTNKPTFVFIRLNSKKNKLGWKEMSYDKQLKRITSKDGLLVYSLACCAGKVYALNTDNGFGSFVIKVEILVRDRIVLINLSLLGMGPYAGMINCSNMLEYLKGSCTKLFHISVGIHDEAQKKPSDLCLFKLDMTKRKKTEVFKDLDMTSRSWIDPNLTIINTEDIYRYEDLDMTGHMWEEMEDLKDATFFVDVSRDSFVSYSSEVASKFRGFIYIRGITSDILYSYHVKKRTISISSMPFSGLPTSHVSMWECRLGDDNEEATCATDSGQDEEDKECGIVVRSITDHETEFNESQLLNLPFPILEMIMELCVCSAYMNFRATSKLCHLAAPLIQRGNKTTFRRLQNYSLLSPWLVVVDKKQDILTFTDPISGDHYYMNNLKMSIYYNRLYIDDEEIFCSRFGWLLYCSGGFLCLEFFNPFTSDLLELPAADCYLFTVCFSAPPTSPDCMVVGFSKGDNEWHVSVHFVAQDDSSWRTLSLGSDPHTLRFPTFKGRDLYALGNEGRLIVFKDLGDEDFSWKLFEAEAPTSSCKSLAKYYLMTCDQHLILVVVSEFGELVEVFKWNDATEEWEKLDSIGKHMIYICGTTCICIEAKIPEMENNIYFPRLHSKNGEIVFYSLETCMFHTFSGKIMEENFKDFKGTHCHVNAHAWIEPCWS